MSAIGSYLRGSRILVLAMVVGVAACDADRPQVGDLELIEAMSHGDSQRLEDWIQQNSGEINRKVESQEGTALHLAAFLGDAKAVSLLLKAGADPEVRDSFGGYAIQEAIRSKGKRDGDWDAVINLLTLPKVEKSVEDLKEYFVIRLLEDSYLAKEAISTEERPVEWVLSIDRRAPSPAFLASVDKLIPDKVMAPGPERPWRVKSPDNPPRAEWRTIDIRFTEWTDDLVQWRMCLDCGFLSGGGSEGYFKWQHGYWIESTTSYRDH